MINEFGKLPGIGGKTAQRLAFHVLSLTDREAEALAESILEAKQNLHYCEVCGNLTDKELCGICSDAARDRSVICVVETPQDVMAMERIREYNGLYHVLHGAISPAEGIGPADINLKSLIERLQSSDEVKEVIIATNPNIEGEATAMYIGRPRICGRGNIAESNRGTERVVKLQSKGRVYRNEEKKITYNA